MNSPKSFLIILVVILLFSSAVFAEVASLSRNITESLESSLSEPSLVSSNSIDVSVPEQPRERKFNISGTKTFEMKKAQVKGDIGHFSTENFDSIPGFRLDQSLHLEIDGYISHNTKVSAVLDDKDDEERRFTVYVDGKIWDLTLGDFPLAIPKTEFLLHNKEVRGVLAEANFQERWKWLLLYSRSKGQARREQFRGAGHQQEFRLSGKPVVQNSERIYVDGRQLIRGTDYYIDFEDGVIKFQPHILPIEITSWIVVEYEVSDSKLAFKRNLIGSRLIHNFGDKGYAGFSIFREADDTTPKSDYEASGTVRPMEHKVFGIDGEWKINNTYSLKGEQIFSEYDPNFKSEVAPQDKRENDYAYRFSLLGKNEKFDAELSRRFVGKLFRMVGRDEGVTELGERGLVRDILKQNGRLSYKYDKHWTIFGSLENSETNRSKDPNFSSINFLTRRGGVTYNFGQKSLVEGRLEIQKDKEIKKTVLSDREKHVKTLVWDYEIGNYFLQTKLERTVYDDNYHTASGSRVTHALCSIGSDINKTLTWNISAGRIYLDDDLDLSSMRSETQNYTLDVNYDPSKIFNARGIFQWRKEKDFLVNVVQRDEIADSRLQYRPTPDLRTQLKYKVENTTKVIRDPTLDPTKYIRPPSLPLEKKDKQEVVGRFENPVQKRTGNFMTNYRIGEKIETNFDWKRRDLKDRILGNILSFNDRKSYELRFTPARKWKFSSEYEDGLIRNEIPKSELKDMVKRFGVINEFREGYILETRFENRVEDDKYVSENDRETTSKSLDFQRIFSKKASLELGIQRNEIEHRQPSKEWEKRMAFIVTPSARSQRYKFFVTHKSIEAQKNGSRLEGGVNFSQVIGTDTMVDGEVKKVKSTAGYNGSGYDGMVANAKMVITF